MKDIDYNWKFALFTLAILVIGSFIIITTNSNGHPNVNVFLLYVFPFLSFVSFIPVMIDKVSEKIKRRKESYE